MSTADDGKLKSAKQTASQDTPCINAGARPIVSVTALLKLARWNQTRRRSNQGGQPCDAPTSDSAPPQPERSGSPCPPERPLEGVARPLPPGPDHGPHTIGGPAPAAPSGRAG